MISGAWGCNDSPFTQAKVNRGGEECRLQSLEADAEMKLDINNTF